VEGADSLRYPAVAAFVREPGQGVAYLDDGTMVVIENGRRLVGETVTTEVTTVLQTSAGRMIFARARANEPKAV